MRGHYERRTWRSDPTLYAPQRYRRACEYEAFVPDELAGLDVDIAASVAGVISEAEAAIAQLNRVDHRAFAPLARFLLRTEAIASSKVEGLQSDTAALARAEVKQDAGRSIGAEAAEILANIAAMELAIERATEAIALGSSELRDIHRRLMERDPRQRAIGRFRDEQNWIGGNDYNPCGADFVPPPPGHVERLMSDLCGFCDDDRLPPLVQAAVAHAQFETIHPFEDGNGRTGRALIHVVLRRRRLSPIFVPPISVIFAGDKERYIRGLTDFRGGRVNEWLETFAAAAASAAMLGRRYLDEVEDLKLRWAERLRSHGTTRADAAAWTLLDVLPAHPIISVLVAVAAIGRTRPAVAHAIDELESAGVLRRLGESRRNRWWEAEGLLDLMARFESGELLPKRSTPPSR